MEKDFMNTLFQGAGNAQLLDALAKANRDISNLRTALCLASTYQPCVKIGIPLLHLNVMRLKREPDKPGRNEVLRIWEDALKTLRVVEVH